MKKHFQNFSERLKVYWAEHEYFIKIHKVVNEEKLRYTFCTEDVENENEILFFELNNN